MARGSNRSAVVAIVDDDPIMGESLVQRLGLEGYDTAWWKAGREAASRLAQQDVDLVLCDIRLPDIDGWRVLAHLKDDVRTRHLPVYVISTDEEPERSIQGGAIRRGLATTGFGWMQSCR